MYLNSVPVHDSSMYTGSTVEEKSINLIIIDDSFDSEERIVSSLRATGYAARSIRAEDEEDLENAINTQRPDLVIYFCGMSMISLAQTSALLKKHVTTGLCRTIAVVKDGNTGSVVEAMRDGAVDLVSYENIDHLMMVIAREQKALNDARQKEQLNKSLYEAERRCNSLLDSSRDAIAYIHEGMHIYSNDSYLELFDIAASDELEGLPVLDMISTDQREAFKSFLRDYAKNEDSAQTLQTQLRKPDGSEFEGEMEFSPARIDNEPCIQIIIRQQAHSPEELEKQLKLLSQKDQLTGIYNRQYFIESLVDVISQCEEGKYTAVVMEIQLDNFNSIKDTVGITDADNYITAAATALNAAIDDQTILARYTHSTFACISTGLDRAGVEKLAAQFQSVIAALVYDEKANSINTTCSIGAALIDDDTPEYNAILSQVEKALHEATEKGVNQICIHEQEKGELTRQEIDTRFKDQLTRALKEDNFVLHFQPVVSLHGDTEERYEVFVRLKNIGNDESQDNLIMPQDFLPAAERIGLATAIDRWVLYQTINQILQRSEKGIKTHFFLKLSAASIKDDTLIDWLSYQVKEKKLPADSLAFVVKESVAVTNLKHTKELSQFLRMLNCGFIVDDFGSGTNPFQLLQHIQADYIRIDPNYMQDLTDNPQHQEHVKMIADKAGELGKLTIAQRVPDAASLSVLWGMGINFIQGNFLQEPSETLEYDFTEMSG